MNKVVTIWLTLILTLFAETALGELIEHGDNSEDGYISTAMIIANSSNEYTSLSDTEINFDSVSSIFCR